MKTVKILLCLLSGILCWSVARAATGDATDSLNSSRFFDQPLIWVGDTPPAPAESEALWNAFGVGRVKRLDDALGDLENFIKTHPDSPWTPSLNGNLGRYYRDHGYFSLALDHWQASWEATKDMSDARGKEVADYTLVNWLNLLASLGRTDAMKDLFARTQGRIMSAPLQTLYNQSRDGYLIMLAHPEVSYRCGTYALNNVAQVLRGTNYFLQIVNQPSPKTGFSMASLLALAESNHLDMVAVQRPEGQQDIVVPSVVHWKQNHYAAIIAKRADSYEVVDPTFRFHKWLTGTAINAECSGQFLVADTHIPAGWESLALEQTAQIFGKGFPSNFDPPPPPCTTCPCPPGSGGSGGSAGGGGAGGAGGAGGGGGGGGPKLGGSSCSCASSSASSSTGGMPDWKVSEPYVDLRLHDEPLAYQSSVSRMSFQIDYWQRDDRIPSANVFTMGPDWECSWQAYILTDGTPYDPVTLYGASGGEIQFTDLTGATPNYYYNLRMMAVTNSSGALTGYDVFYPNGAEDIYGFLVTDSYGNITQVYLSQKIDEHGRVTQFMYTPFSLSTLAVQLNYVIDPDGKTNTISYTSNGTYNYLISQVQDPFGHHVNFSYDANGYLTNVTDEASLSSSFAYDTAATYWLNQLNTPYGTTSFAFTGGEAESDTTTRSIVISEPNGSHQMFIYDGQDNNGYLAFVNPAPYPSNVPEANLDGQGYMYYRNSFYWGRQQFVNLSPAFLATGPSSWDITQLNGSDYTNDARIQHWNHSVDGGQSDSLSMEQDPSPDGINLGEVTWYNYPNKPSYLVQGSSASPSLVIKVLPDGTEWYEQYLTDQWGNQTNVISTWSSGGVLSTRTNSYVLAANGVDLLQIIGPDGVRQVAYGYDAGHQVLFMTNALGEVTSYTYNANEMLTSATLQNGLVTTNIYGVDKFLAQKIAEGISTNSYTYTNGLIFTQTDERNLTLTNSWDALQRLTNVAYPDGTAISYVYSNLDLARVTDRMGFVSSYTYTPIRQLLYATNAAGRVTSYGYCECGALAQVTDPLGNITLFTHDNQGNLTQTVYPDGYTLRNTYNAIRQVVNTSDSSGMSMTNYYNNQGMLVASTNNVGRVLALAYDINDLITNSIRANGIDVGMSYDNAHRLILNTYPDSGVEKYGYTFGVQGATSYTNQIGHVTLFTYDVAGRKIAQTNALNNVELYSYNGAGDLVRLVDERGNATVWVYDQFGRVTNKMDGLGTNLFVYQYDQDNRMTNAWSGAMSNVVYRYDQVGNMTNLVCAKPTAIAASTNVIFNYDAMNQITNMVDGVGVTAFGYDAAGQMTNEAGPWPNESINFIYTNRLRTSLKLPSTPWSQTYGYDAGRRLTGITSPAGTFSYVYDPALLQSVDRLLLPNASIITNTYDSMARMTLTELMNSSGADLDSYAYTYNLAGQRTQVSRTAGDYVNYGYDNIGELTSSYGFTPSAAARVHEHTAYSYDAAGNLIQRLPATAATSQVVYGINRYNQITNSTMGSLSGTAWSAIEVVSGATTQPATNVTVNGSIAALYGDNTFALNTLAITNGLNTFTAIGSNSPTQLSTNVSAVTVILTNTAYQYDLNGNLLADGIRTFAYDDQNQLISVWRTNVWRNDFVYDGKMRRRIERDFTWSGSAWTETNEIHFVYDGNLVVQELNVNNQPMVEYTRGRDLSGTLQGADGDGGLLAMSQDSLPPMPFYTASSYYHADANANVTMLVDGNQNIVAKYLYDSFGNLLAQSGSLADANVYRFSSKEWNANSATYYYLFRFYDPNLQRWLNRDPIQELGGINLYEFVANSPIDDGDYLGLASVGGPGGVLGGLSGPYKAPGGFINGLKGGGLATVAGAVLSHFGNQKMKECPSKNCKKSDCESCCKKGAALSGLGDAAGAAAGCIGSLGWGCVFAGIGAAINGYDTYHDYKDCMAGCASKSN